MACSIAGASPRIEVIELKSQRNCKLDAIEGKLAIGVIQIVNDNVIMSLYYRCVTLS